MGGCCLKGQVKLPALPEPPEPLLSLLTTATTPAATQFRRRIRSYNSALQLASSGVKVDERFDTGEHPALAVASGILYGALWCNQHMLHCAQHSVCC